MRGLVMVLMTIDHASHAYNAGALMTDAAFSWQPGSPLPWAQFMTRWITHLCAPTFVLLAGTSLALSTEKRRDQPGQTAFIVKRGFLIAALDPTWMTLAFTAYAFFVLQVLYAIGIALVCMAYLRRLSSRTLLIIGVAIQALGELTTKIPALPRPLSDLLQLTFV